MSRVAELAARRDGLLLRSAALRVQLQQQTDDIDYSLRRIDRGIGLVRRAFSSRPLLLAAGAGLLVTLGPRKAFRWVSRGLLMTSVARRAYGLYTAMRAPSGRAIAHDDDQLFV
jgi:hypothetical protein